MTFSPVHFSSMMFDQISDSRIGKILHIQINSSTRTLVWEFLVRKPTFDTDWEPSISLDWFENLRLKHFLASKIENVLYESLFKGIEWLEIYGIRKFLCTRKIFHTSKMFY